MMKCDDEEERKETNKRPKQNMMRRPFFGQKKDDFKLDYDTDTAQQYTNKQIIHCTYPNRMDELLKFRIHFVLGREDVH